jgi:hypothetical protein
VEPVVVAAAEESSAPPQPVPATAVEEGQMAVEATTPQAALEPPAEAGPGGADVVVVSNEDSVPPPPTGDHDVVMTSVPKPTPAARVPEPSPASEVVAPSSVAEVPEPSPTAEVLEPSQDARVVWTSSAVGAVTVEEVMELATSRYIDLPGVGIVDLDAPELPSKVLDVTTERMFAEPSILEMIVSVSRALHHYDRASGFALPAASGAAEAVSEASAAGTESVADASMPPPTSEGQEASLS